MFDKHLSSFDFISSAAPESRAGMFVVTIPAGISRVDELFKVLERELQLPGYFGFNWNALSDCLRDLGWIEEREVVLWHHDVPAIPEIDRAIYLDVLVEAVQSWGKDEAHMVRVVFPEGSRSEMRNLIPDAGAND